jgi:Rho-binding antiterminator
MHPTPALRTSPCDLLDVIEATATRRAPALVEFIDGGGALRRLHARVLDIVTRDGAEHVRLGSGEWVRLDRIVAVDGVHLAGQAH